MALTGEQRAVVEMAAAGENLVVDAAAGSGKTHTLREAAMRMRTRRGRQLRGRYLAYNSAAAKEAKGKFPKHVWCSTVHGLAWKPMAAQFDERNRIPLGLKDRGAPRQTARRVAELLRIVEPIACDKVIVPPSQLGHVVTDTLDTWCQGIDPEITTEHVPAQKGLTEEGNAYLAREILPLARKAWQNVCDVENGTLNVKHDYYLRMWYDSGQAHLPVDYILYDEAQDANPLSAAIVLEQRHAQLIAVGDQYQQLYCQPVGTMVEVPVTPDPVDADKRCRVDGCPRRRDHKGSGLCDGHEQHVRAGKEPFDITRVSRRVETARMPIESLSEGDLVVTYHNSHVFKRGRPITSTTRFRHDGPLVRVTTGSGLTSTYTPKHHCVVRVGRGALDGKHVVYLMRRGDQFRVGRVPFFYASQSNSFGVGLRAAAERADAAWILSVHDTVKDAALAEVLTQNKFNIPSVRFRPSNRDLLNVDAFWEKYGSNRDKAEACLTHHGRLIEFPLWTSGSSNLVGNRRPFVTAAANLIDGFMVLPFGKTMQYAGKRDHVAPARQWEPVTVTTEWYSGDVVSLEVADHHTYYADGILTHNSWRGAVDAMRNWPADTRLMLSQSFRFDEAIAEEANKWLELMWAKMRVRGTPGVGSELVALDAPTAVLCRTNAGCMEQAMAALEAGRRPALANGGKAIKDFAEAALLLQNNDLAREAAHESGQEAKQTRVSHPDLFAFTSWEEVQEYVDSDPGGQDIRTMVNLVDNYGPEKLITAVESMSPRSRADVIISTGHGAKGLEWPSVLIHEDFVSPGFFPDGTRKRLPKSYGMLAYVAVTRARHQLDRRAVGWVDEWLADHRGAQALAPAGR
jgi:hypothetical protein